MRKVASPEGSRYYGLPIGTPITADVLDKARKANKGKPPPKGASKQSRTTSRGSTAALPENSAPAQVKTAKANPKAAAAKAAAETPKAGKVSTKASRKVKGKAKVTTPTLSGPTKFTAGGSDYEAPAGSKAFTHSSAQTPPCWYFLMDLFDSSTARERSSCPLRQRLASNLSWRTPQEISLM